MHSLIPNKDHLSLHYFVAPLWLSAHDLPSLQAHCRTHYYQIDFRLSSEHFFHLFSLLQIIKKEEERGGGEEEGLRIHSDTNLTETGAGAKSWERRCELHYFASRCPQGGDKRVDTCNLEDRKFSKKNLFNPTPKSTFICRLCKIMSVVGEIKSQEPRPTPVYEFFMVKKVGQKRVHLRE